MVRSFPDHLLDSDIKEQATFFFGGSLFVFHRLTMEQVEQLYLPDCLS